MSFESNSAVKLYIDLESIKKNYLSLKSLTKAELSAVIKANAYGLGAIDIAKALSSISCEKFFVANIKEAIELRENINAPINIYVLNGILSGEEKEFHHYNLKPVLNNPHQVKIWHKFLTSYNAIPLFNLHIDTGMHRLGLFEKDINELVNLNILKDNNLEIVMTHLACSHNLQDTYNKVQLENFNKISNILPKAKQYSISSSNGIFLGEEFHKDLIRPGMALYGRTPGALKNSDINMQPVISVFAPIIHLQYLEEEANIGYSGTAKASKGSKLATIPLGHADGYPRSLSNKGVMYLDDYPVRVIGRVSMDLITLDVTNVPDNLLHIGKHIEVIGKNNTIDNMAETLGTVPYEIMTALGSRFQKIYNTNNKP